MAERYNRSGSEESEDFNPQAEIDEDDIQQQMRKETQRPQHHDDDEEEDGGRDVANGDEEDEEGEPTAGGGEDEEDEEDDEEEEDEDEEDVVGRPKKRRRRDKRLNFLDVEAEVDDEDEEELDDLDDELPDEVHPDDLALERQEVDRDDRKHRELDQRRQAEQQLDAEQLAARIDEKYRRREMARAQRGTGAVPLDLPTVNDPSIWAVKCRPGKEREIIMAIMKKIDERIHGGHPLKVYSAFERGGTMQGYIYVEADAKQDMIEACENVTNVFMGTPPIAIDVKERPDLLRKRKREPPQVGNYVRIKRPVLYQGDLAKIIETHGNGLDYTVAIVPRLHYGLNEDQNAPKDGKRKRPGWGSAAPRPEPKLFNEAEAKKRHVKYLQQVGSGSSKSFTYKNEEYQNGYLIKEVKLNHFTTENVNPQMWELQLFSTLNGEEGMDLAAVQAAQNASRSGASYVPGDNVEVYDGEQKGIRGTAVSVRGDIVSLKVSEGALQGQTIEAPVKTLRKLFREGDHVKVTGSSKYMDEVGMVTRIRDDKVTLLTDSTQEEITVFSRDLKRAADSATLGGDSGFELYDLVQLDAATVACVTKVDRETLRVLDQTGSVRTVLQSQINALLEKRRNAVATDRDGSEIRHDDTVKEQGGEGRQGRVLYIHRSYLFVQNREQVENAGVFVTRSTNVTTLAAKSSRQQAGPDLSKMNPNMVQPGLNGTSMPPPRSMGRDRMIGKTVTVRKGAYKGLLGIVKDTNADEARVELHTKNKIINIKKELLNVKDPVTGNNMEIGGKFPNRSRGMPNYGAGATPGRDWSGGRTPGWGSSRGPSWGTPAGGRTPGWGSGGRTAYGGNDGSRTAYGGDGSRTAYGGATAYGGDGSRTAYGGNDGSRTAYGGFNSGGRTPGWGGAPSGSKTPAYNSHSSSNGGSSYAAPTPGAYQAPTPAPYQAPTPGAWGAPTPGAALDAPTPGSFSAPTPGDSGHYPTPKGYGGYGATPAAAPTPGAWPDTPWGGAPETPAATGEDDPRYD